MPTGKYTLSDIADQPAQIQTGANASGTPYQPYAQGQVKLPNDGQVTTGAYTADDVDNSSPAAGSIGNLSPTSSTPGMLDTIKAGASNLAKGAAKGIAGDVSNIDNAVAKIPGVGNWLTTPLVGGHSSQEARAQLSAASTPHGMMQGIGRGIEQAGEFLVPGLGEEKVAAKAAELAPRMAGVLKPAARIGYNALTSGAVNAAQGGGFGSGAMAGAGGGAIGEGMRAVAPALAESAIGIRKGDRAYGRTPGRMILDETTGLSPRAVATSAQGKLDQLNPALDRLADEASVRSAPPVRGFLMPPQQEFTLHSSPVVEGKLSVPTVLTQADRPTRPLLQPPSIHTPMSSHASIFPDQLPGSDTGMRASFGQPASGLGQAQYIGSIAGERGGPGMPQGVMYRRPEMSASMPAATEANRVASLGPARTVVGNAIGRATAQNAEKEASQLQPMDKFLSQRFSTGAAIPEQITPREMLDLRRGFGSEFVHNWNPEVSPGVTGTARRAYGALTDAFHSAVPETADLDRRIGGLIPVAKRADSAALNAPLAQRLAGRFKAHTGALAGAVGGGLYGYGEGGGIPGAVKGATIGLLVPEILGSPTTLMGAARVANAPGAMLRGLTGGALQLADRNKDKIYSRRGEQ